MWNNCQCNFYCYSTVSMHEKMKNFECSLCDYNFAQKGSLTQHISSVHEGKKPFECSICDYKCSTKQCLTIHITSIHEGKKPIECSICNQKFSVKGKLTQHIEIYHASRAWLSTRHQFMRARNHLKAFHYKRETWLSTSQ